MTIAADTVLATSSPTIGQLLTEKKVQHVPIIGKRSGHAHTAGGLDNLVATGAPGASAFGRETTTPAGVSAQSVPLFETALWFRINGGPLVSTPLPSSIRTCLAKSD